MPTQVGYAFGPYQLDVRSRRLLRDSAIVALSPRQIQVLLTFVQQAGKVLTKDALIAAAWGGAAVSDNSVERLVSDLRILLDPNDRRAYIINVNRQGYQFVAAVTEVAAADDVVDVEALLAPHRAWVEGVAALQTLQRAQIVQARATFQQRVAERPRHAPFHVGLAMASAFEFESTRADPAPNIEALGVALRSAHTACQLDPDAPRAWGALGFALVCKGDRPAAREALDRAITLDPEEWQHRFTLTLASWGGDRLRAARETLRRCPGLPLAHVMAASVLVARHDLDHAMRDVRAAVRAAEIETTAAAGFSAVAVHYLDGLLRFAGGDVAGALAAFDAELAGESRGHLYGRECCANTLCAKGAVLQHAGDHVGARDAFTEALVRIPSHPQAHAGLARLDGRRELPFPLSPDSGRVVFEVSLAHAVVRAATGDQAGAVALLTNALRTAPPGSSGWLIPVDPLLRVWEHPDAWAPVLALLNARAR